MEETDYKGVNREKSKRPASAIVSASRLDMVDCSAGKKGKKEGSRNEKRKRKKRENESVSEYNT
jgi:hypothetical protein